MNGVRDKLNEWLENNPDGWLTESEQSIAQQAKIAAGSVARHLYILVAKREGIMPSEARRQRQEARPVARRTKVDMNEIRKIIAENPDAPVCDLAYLANCPERTIERVLKTMDPESEESPEDSTDIVQDIKAEVTEVRSGLDNVKTEIEELLTRLDELLKD